MKAKYDVTFAPESGDGMRIGTVHSERAATALSKASSSKRVFAVGDTFAVTAVGLFQLTRSCSSLVFGGL